MNFLIENILLDMSNGAHGHVDSHP